MGLDIYFKKCKKLRERKDDETLYEYLDDLYTQHRNKMAELAKSTLKKYRDKIADAKEEQFLDLRSKLMKELAKIYEYDFYYRSLKTAPNKSLFVTEIEKFLSDEKKWEYFFPVYAAYFRKVNFLYSYFNDRLEDEHCIVTQDDLKDIITKAKIVLKEHDEEVSKSLLPTQEGFFFGDTTYSQYYYEDVKDVIKKFKAVLKDWKDDEILYVYMSW